MTIRHFAHRRILRMPPASYATAIRLLTAAIPRRLGSPAAVIGIANGGLTPARSLAEALDAPAYQVSARHNRTDAVYTQATGRVDLDLTPLADTLSGRRLPGLVLLVDDIYGSGATINALRPALTPYLAPRATLRAVTLCRNVGGRGRPDLWIWDVDDWVHFPWEPAPAPGFPAEELRTPRRVRRP